jgi:hypothetical protein
MCCRSECLLHAGQVHIHDSRHLGKSHDGLLSLEQQGVRLHGDGLGEAELGGAAVSLHATAGLQVKQQRHTRDGHNEDR